MKTILFANVRDEPHLREWVNHHLSIGFSKVYLFDHLSVQPVRNEMMGVPNVIVERIAMPFANKMRLMLCAASYSLRNGYDWMMYLDADEFLFLRNDDTVESFLSRYPSSIHQIGLNWVVFGSNFLDKKPKDIIPAYTRSLPQLHREVKCFVRPGMVNTRNIPSPHFFFLKPGGRSVGWDSEPLTGPHYVDRSGMNWEIATAYVAHYIVQAYEVYEKRKLSRERDDLPGARWPVIKRDVFHNQYNQVQNLDLITRYGRCYNEEENKTEQTQEHHANQEQDKSEEIKQEEEKPEEEEEKGQALPPLQSPQPLQLPQPPLLQPPPPQRMVRPAQVPRTRFNYYTVSSMRSKGSF